jgi:UDP-2-acetamido-3-amino-2,3-dideoxy-glucuronate N-acetyltransferase
MHMTNNIKIAVIGVGYWGKNLVRSFSELGSLYCVSDNNPNLAEAIAKQYSVPVLSFEQILRDEAITAVVVVTPTVTHYEFVKKSLEANKHVFVEKPMTLDLNHARELQRLAESKQRKLMVGHLLQYHPVFVKLKELVHSGALGPIQYIYSHRLDLGKIYTQKDALWDKAPHDLSMILSLVNEAPTLVNAAVSCNLMANASDFAMVNLEFATGAKAHVFVSWLNPFKEQKLTVVCKNGMAVFDDTKSEWHEKLAIYRHKVEVTNESIVTIKEAPEFLQIERSEPLKNECQHFIDCIENDLTPITGGLEALRVMEALVQARQSAYSQEKELV